MLHPFPNIGNASEFVGQMSGLRVRRGCSVTGKVCGTRLNACPTFAVDGRDMFIGDEATHRHLLRSGDRPGGTGYPVSRGWEPDTRSWAARHSRLGIGTERVADRRKRRARGLAQ